MMKFGYCNQSVVPVRSAPSHTAEMVNQLLFGETFEINDGHGDFLLIRGSLDKYEGFISNKQFLPLAGEEYLQLNAHEAQFPVKSISMMEELNSGSSFPILNGSSLRGFKNETLELADMIFRYKDPIQKPQKVMDRAALPHTAMQFLHAPYLWGGRSLFGIDCSGLVQVTLALHGINIQRDAAYQSQSGEMVNLTSEAVAGDLAFFDDQEGKIVHTGILVENRKIIHASGCVKIDDFDQQGIYNRQTNKYTHKLRVIKRLG
jgi:gamma-D-glutamyl-L-lysine dipeptidyl-peptidase